jgi:hypothetical protein
MATLSSIITPSNVETASSTSTLTNKTIDAANNTVTNIPLSTGVTGTLPVANGGTGDTSLSGITVGTATNVAGGSNGTIPYQSAAGTTQMLAVGSAGQLLQTNGAGAPTWVAPPAGGSMIFLSTVTASSSSTVDIETTFDSTYDEYVIKVSNFIPDTSNVGIRSRLKVGGSYDTGSNYSSAAVTMNNTGDSYSGNEGGTTIFVSSDTIGANRPTSFEYRVHSPASTSYAKGVDWAGFFYRNGATLGAWFAGGGANSSTSALTGVRFYLTSGVITAGTFRLYGIKKS